MLNRILAFLQAIATADKAAVVAAGVSAITLLALTFGLRLNGADTAYIAALLSALVGAFTHVHFARKAAKPRA